MVMGRGTGRGRVRVPSHGPMGRRLSGEEGEGTSVQWECGVHWECEPSWGNEEEGCCSAVRVRVRVRGEEEGCCSAGSSW